MLVTILALSVFFSRSQQTAEKYVQVTQYLLYLPDGYTTDTAKRWPLMIFLHGSGEAGTDLNKVKTWGPPKLIEAGKKFPFIVVSPQAPPNTGWAAEVLRAMLNDVKQKYRVDNDRVYLTGLSMGGFGTWNYSEKFPDDLAAIVPICGGGDVSKVWQLRHMPIWCFHGAKDDVVPPSSSQQMVDALRKYNPGVRFTLYPDLNHNSWEVTYNNDSLYTWLLSQKKFRYTPTNVSQQILQEYVGAYVNAKHDTIRMAIENEKLYALPPHEKVELKASSKTNFYWDDNSTNEVQFILNKEQKVNGFVVMGGEMDEFTKLPLVKMRK